MPHDAPLDSPPHAGSSGAALVVHPALARLRRELAALRSELSWVVLASRDLELVVKPYILALFQRKLGPAELARLRAEVRFGRARRRLEAIQACVNVRAVPDLARIDAALDEELAEHYARIVAARVAVEAAHLSLGVTIPHADVTEAKRLYRALVLRLHPDLHPEQSQADVGRWHRVQQAYEAFDLESLRALAEVLGVLATSTGASSGAEVTPDPTDGSDAFTILVASLGNEVLVLTRKLRLANEKWVALQATSPFTLRADLENDDWVAARCGQLDDETRAFDARAASLEARAHALFRGGPDDSRFGPD